MKESFELVVSYKGKDLSFDATLLPYGYTHRIVVLVYDREVVFEPDEERNYRAWVDPLHNTKTQLDVELLKAIAETIESILK